MFCPKCGLQIDGSPKFCPKCGEPLVTSDAQQNARGPAAGAGAPADGGTIAVVEKVLAACFAIFFVLRALTYVGALFRAGYYRYYYSSVFGIIIACLCLLLLIAGALLLAGTIASYGFLGREDQKKDLLVAVLCAWLIRFLLTLFSLMLPPYAINRWLDFFMGLAAVIIFFALRYVQDSDVFSQFKGRPLGMQLSNALEAVSDSVRNMGGKKSAPVPAAQTVPPVVAQEGQVQPAAQPADTQQTTAPQQTYVQTPPPVGNGFLPTDRSLPLYIILSIVTCGIYGYYFLYTMARDTNIACAGDGETTPGLAQLILLSLVTCGIYAFYWDYKIGDRLFKNGPRYGLTFTENGTTILMWDIIGLLIGGIGHYIAMYFLIKNLNSICVEYNQRISAQN